MSDLPNLEELDLFLAVVDTGSIGAAAKARGISQPQASRVIARLEQKAKQPLLQRSPKGSIPSPAGLELAIHAHELLREAESFESWFTAASATASRPPFRLGASLTIADGLLPAWLAQLRRLSPRLIPELMVSNSTTVIACLKEGTVELGLVETPNLPDELVHHPIGADRLLVTVSPEHPWANREGPISSEELIATPLILREAGSGTREALEAALPELQQVSPYQVLQSNVAVRIAAASGAAPAVLSELAVQEQLLTGELIAVPVNGELHETLRRPLTALMLPGREPSVAVAEFLRVALFRGDDRS